MEARWSKHKSELNRNVHFNSYLQNAWNKHGEKDFVFYVLEYCDIQDLDDRENYHINQLNTMNRDCGYNLKSGGQASWYYSEEIRKKQSESLKKAYLNPEMHKRQSDNALRQWANPEIKAKICGANNCMYGKHHTEEAKKKISLAHIGKPCSKRNTTPVFCLELNQEYKDATDASKQLSLDSSGILKVCRGERKTCGGYHWKFLKLENNIS